MDLAVCPHWPGPSGRQPGGTAAGFLWVALPILEMLACSLAELFRLYRWLCSARSRKVDKSVQVNLPPCDIETVMTQTIESIKAELASFQATKGGTKEVLAERLCEFRKRAMYE